MGLLFVAAAGIRVDGANLADGNSDNRWLNLFRQTDAPFKVLTGVATGKVIEEYHQRDSGSSTWKPSVCPYHQWEGWNVTTDDTALAAFDAFLYRNIAHNMVTGVVDTIIANTDGTRTILDLDRQLLGVGYSRVNGAGVNSGATVVSVSVVSYNGTTFTPIYAGAPAAGEVRVSVTGDASPFRLLTFNAADIAALGSVAAALTIRGVFMYQVAPDPAGPVREFMAQTNGRHLPTFRYSMIEKGEPD